MSRHFLNSGKRSAVTTQYTFTRYATVFVFPWLGPAHPCRATITHVLQLPALSPERGGQDSVGKVLLPNTGKSKEQEVDYMHALLLATSCTLLFPPERQWSSYVDKGTRVWKLMSEGILLGWGNSASLGLRENKVICSCVLVPQFCRTASPMVPGNLSE